MNMEDAGGRTMFRKGEYVIYGNNGICCIEEIGVPRDTPLGDSGKEYYTLAPVFSSGKIYAPLDTKDRKSTRLNSSHNVISRMPSSA